ncbi:MAG: hypothetical protein CMM07_01445 [Rhodopirellula sp.]|nr:hypothetical protein [Rhodopirellula sp.]
MKPFLLVRPGIFLRNVDWGDLLFLRGCRAWDAQVSIAFCGDAISYCCWMVCTCFVLCSDRWCLVTCQEVQDDTAGDEV